MGKYRSRLEIIADISGINLPIPPREGLGFTASAKSRFSRIFLKLGGL